MANTDTDSVDDRLAVADRDEREERERLFKRYEVIGKSLGSARRLEIIDLLVDGPRTVEDVAASTSMSVANTSQHLRQLHNAGLLKVRREGSYAHYSLAVESDITLLWNAIRTLAHTIDPGLRFERLDIAGVSADQLEKVLDDPRYTVIDVRSALDFAGGRIRSSISIPLESLETRVNGLDPDAEYIVYDQGPPSMLGDLARSILLQAGYEAKLLHGGYNAWKTAGRATTRSIASN